MAGLEISWGLFSHWSPPRVTHLDNSLCGARNITWQYIHNCGYIPAPYNDCKDIPLILKWNKCELGVCNPSIFNKEFTGYKLKQDGVEWMGLGDPIIRRGETRGCGLFWKDGEPHELLAEKMIVSSWLVPRSESRPSESSDVFTAILERMPKPPQSTDPDCNGPKPGKSDPPYLPVKCYPECSRKLGKKDPPLPAKCYPECNRPSTWKQPLPTKCRANIIPPSNPHPPRDLLGGASNSHLILERKAKRPKGTTKGQPGSQPDWCNGPKWTNKHPAPKECRWNNIPPANPPPPRDLSQSESSSFPIIGRTESEIHFLTTATLFSDENRPQHPQSVGHFKRSGDEDYVVSFASLGFFLLLSVVTFLVCGIIILITELPKRSKAKKVEDEADELEIGHVPSSEQRGGISEVCLPND